MPTLTELRAAQAALAALPADDPQRPALQARIDRMLAEMDRAAMARGRYSSSGTRAARWRRADSFWAHGSAERS